MANPTIEYAGSRRAGVRRRRREIAEARSLAARVDWILLGAVVALVAYGLYAIAGITRRDLIDDPDYYVVRQAFYAAIGMVGLAITAWLDPDLFRRYWRHLYVASLVALALVMLPLGTEVRGSQRWIALGPLTIQPSELVKLTLVLAVAGFVAERARSLGDPRTVLTAVGLALGASFFVFLQPDIGTALVYTAALAGILFVAGARWTHLGALVTAAAFVVVSILWLLPAAGLEVLEPYQRARLTAFLDRSTDPQGASYNVIQSITTVGAGGVDGRGVEGATQTNFAYLPHHASDFAFASLAEQRGFVGASILLLLYLLIVWRALRVVTLARDAYSAIVAGGIVLALLFQVFVNVGMTMGIAPITGIPLPFVSVGGSALISNLLAIGVLQAIHVRARANARA
jgi:rod shape determining protein RodA